MSSLSLQAAAHAAKAVKDAAKGAKAASALSTKKHKKATTAAARAQAQVEAEDEASAEAARAEVEALAVAEADQAEADEADADGDADADHAGREEEATATPAEIDSDQLSTYTRQAMKEAAGTAADHGARASADAVVTDQEISPSGPPTRHSGRTRMSLGPASRGPPAPEAADAAAGRHGVDRALASVLAAADAPSDASSPSDSDNSTDSDNAERRRLDRRRYRANRRRRAAASTGGPTTTESALTSLAAALVAANAQNAAVQETMLRHLASAALRQQRTFITPARLTLPVTAKSFYQWRDEMGTLFEQHEVTSFDRQFALAADHWDRTVFSGWYTTTSAALQAAQEPPLTAWPRLLTSLERVFVPAFDIDTALIELKDIRQAASEPMLLYTLRFQQLRMRIPEDRINNNAFVTFVMMGVHSAATKAKRVVEKALGAWRDKHHGCDIPLATLADQLQTADHDARRDASADSTQSHATAASSAALAKQVAEAAAARAAAPGGRQKNRQTHGVAALAFEQEQVNLIGQLQDQVAALSLAQSAAQAAKLPHGSRTPRERAPEDKTFQRANGTWHYTKAHCLILDAGRLCYRCGGKGHASRGCQLPPKDLRRITAADF